MRQRTLGLIGAALLFAGIALNVASEFFAPNVPGAPIHMAGGPGDRGPRR